MKRDLRVAGEPARVEWTLEGQVVLATVNGRPYRLELREVQPRTFAFVAEGQTSEMTVVETATGLEVHTGGRTLQVETLDARTSLRRHHAHHDGVVEVRAPMPGKIVRVLVAEGSLVEAHQGLVVMEAMKMQNEVRSPKKGVLRSLRAQEGAAVNAGDVIAQVE